MDRAFADLSSLGDRMFSLESTFMKYPIKIARNMERVDHANDNTNAGDILVGFRYGLIFSLIFWVLAILAVSYYVF